MVLGLCEAGCLVAGAADGVHQFFHGHGIAAIQNRRLTGEKVNLDLMNTGLSHKRFLDRSFALVTVHPVDPDDRKLIVSHILGHKTPPATDACTLGNYAVACNTEMSVTISAKTVYYR
jgi:hypothetical protein